MLKHGLIWLAAIGLNVAARGADVDYFGVIKSSMYTQAVGSAASPISYTNAFAFTTFVLAGTNGAVTNATVRIPSGATLQLATNLSDPLLGALLPGNTTAWIYTTNFASQGAVDAAFPSSGGSIFPPQAASEYTVNMSTVNDGQQNQKLSYLGITTPPTPNIANLAAAQDIITTNNFNLTWNSLAGGLIPKVVMLTILNEAGQMVYSSPAPFQPGALDGNSTSVTLTNGTLAPGRQYLGHLIVFQPALPNTNYTMGVIGLLRDTAFPLATRALPRPAPARLAALAPANGAFTLELQLEPNRDYRLEATATFASWIELLTTNSPSGVVSFTDTNSASQPWRFFRVIAP